MRQSREWVVCCLWLSLLAGCDLQPGLAWDPPIAADARHRYVASLREGSFALGQAMASDGKRIMVGAPGFDDSGKVFVYELPTAREAPVRLSEWSGPYPREFGAALVLDPPYTLVLDGSRIHVFDDEGKLPTQLGENGDSFASLAAADGRVYAGTPESGEQLVRDGARDAYGVVHVFNRIGDDRERSVLEPRHGERAFGSSIVVRGGWLAVGAPDTPCADGSACGSVTLYRDDEQDGWVFHYQLRGSVADVSFGRAIALDGEQMLVGGTFPFVEGDPGTDTARPYAPGRAYLYQRKGDLWELVSELGADWPWRGQGFGNQVALSRRHIAVAAQGSSQPGDRDSPRSEGAVYLFDRESHTLLYALVPPWERLSPLRFGADFGASLWLDDHWLMVGSPQVEEGSGDLAAYWLDDLLGAHDLAAE